MTRRVLRGIGANLYGQAVTVVAQVATLPVLLHAWGPQALGHWLTLTAWTSLLSLADCGLMSAAGSAAAMAYGRGAAGVAAALLRQLMRVVLRLASGLGVALLAVAVAAAAQGGGAGSNDCATVAALGLAALAGLPLGTLELGFRASGRYAQGMALTSTVRLAETAAVMAVALTGRTPVIAALLLLTIRSLGSVGTYAVLRRRASWLGSPPTAFALDPLRALARPAVAALAIPAALACSLQGVTIAASLVLPAGTVAAFVAARTFTRLLVQAIGLVTHALMPEFALAAGRGDRTRLAALLRVNLLAGAALLVPGWALLVTFGPELMMRWTGRALRPDALAFDLLASAALAHGCWLSASNLLLAVNRQAEFAFRALSVAASSCALAAVLGRLWGLQGVAFAAFAGEAAMVAIVLPAQIAAAFRPAAAAVPVPG